MTTEVRVGILFVVVALLVAVVAIYLTDLPSRLGTYHLTVHFRDVKGLPRAAEVQMSGVKIGKVVDSELRPSPDFPDQPVAVELLVDNEVSLFETDFFVIDQGTIMGDRFVSVRRPTHKQLADAGIPRGDAIRPDTDLAGGPIIGFASLSDRVEELLDKVEKSLHQLTETYAGPELRQNLEQLMGNFKLASGHLTQITQSTLQLVGNLNRLVESNQASVNATISNIEAASAEIQRSAEQVASLIRGITVGPLPAQLLMTVNNIRQSSEDIRAAAEAVRQLVASPENQQRLEQTIANVSEVAENVRVLTASLSSLAADPQVQEDLRASLANLRATTANLREITEASKQIMTSTETLEAITETLANVRETSGQGIEVVEKASRALDRVESTMDRLGEVASSFQPERTIGYLSMEATRDHPLRADINFDLRYGLDPLGFWRVGIRDLGRAESLNLQRAFRLGGRSWSRMGVFGNKPGLALDYQVTPDLLLEAEAWDPENDRLDIRALYNLSPGWELTAGMASFLTDNQPFIGLQRTIYLRDRPAQPDQE